MSIRIAIAGLGYMGMLHLEKAMTIDDVEVVALIEKDRVKLKNVREKLRIPCYEDCREIEGNIDGVIIATPASTHYEIARFFLERGANVFVEKPLALTYDEGERLANFADEKGLKIQVGFVERYNPALKEALKHIENPLYLEARRMNTYAGRSFEIDVILDLMIHDLDILSCIKREKVAFIKAEGVPFFGKALDEASAMIGFEDGSGAIFMASRISLERERSLKVVDEKKIVKIDFLNTKLTIAKKKENGFDISVHDYERKDLIREELEDFILYIKGEKEPKTRARETLFALFLAEKIRHSVGN